MQKKRSFLSVNAILRIVNAAYLLFLCILTLVHRRVPDINATLLTVVPIMLIAVRKREDTPNLILSVITTAGIVFYFIAENFLPHSLLSGGYERTLFGQAAEAFWVLSLYTGVFLLALRDLVTASKENNADGKTVRVIGYILLVLAMIPGTIVLGMQLMLALLNPHP